MSFCVLLHIVPHLEAFGTEIRRFMQLHVIQFQTDLSEPTSQLHVFLKLHIS